MAGQASGPFLHLSAFYSFFNHLTFFTMKKEKKVWAITLIALWFAAPVKTSAQSDSTSHFLNEVVVTATKFDKSVNETGKVLITIDLEQLSRSSGKDLPQVLNEQAGLIVNGATSNPGKDKSVFLQGAKSDYTVVLLDGVPLNDPSGLGGGAYDLRLIPLDQVDRIEVLKGSQSTLYGSDAIAGVINIITKKTVGTQPSISGNLGYGSFNTVRGAAAVSGGVRSIEYNLSYSRFKSDGFSEAKDTTGAAGFDDDGSDQQAIQFNLGIKATESLILRPYLRYNKFSGGYDAGAFTDSKNNFNTLNLLNAGLTATYKTKSGQITGYYGYDRTDRSFESDFGPLSYKGRFQHGEVFWNTEISDRFQFLTGANFQDIKMLDSTATESDPAFTLKSFYASVFLRSWHGLSAEVGGRYNVHSRSGNVFTYSINPSYWIGTQAKLFANVSTGFKSPNLNQLYGAYGANPDLKPERSQSFEGGVHIQNKKGNAFFRANFFQRTIDDVIFFSFDPITFQSLYVNLNKQSDHGFELELNAQPTKALSLRAWYAFVNGQITDKSFGTDSTYNNLFRRPKNTFGVFVGYAVTQKFYVSANFKLTGQRSDLYFNTSSFASQEVILDSYALLDVYCSYKLWNDRLTAWLDAKNLLNQDYYEVFGYNTQPVNFVAGLNFRF